MAPSLGAEAMTFAIHPFPPDQPIASIFKKDGAMTSPPLTDEQFSRVIERHQKNGYLSIPEVSLVCADARWHRAELAKARAENERLREALYGIDARLSALKYVGVSLNNDMQCVLHEARAALREEER